jgi:predicted histone-like DNA-binding protein
MSVKYVTVKKRNPLRPAEPKRYYASVRGAGIVSLQALGKAISRRSKISYSETATVLEAMMQELTEQLSEGKIVRLGGFGSFQVTVSSGSAETKEAVTPSLIKTRKVVFRQSSKLKEMLHNLTFEPNSEE